jgi:aminodeoxyfutalosine synthase
MSTSVPDLAGRLAAGERLDDDAVAALLATTDILILGMLADDARRARHQDRATFVRVFDVAVADGAEMVEVPAGAGEVRLVGTPATLDAAVGSVQRAAAAARLAGAPLSGFSLADLEALAAEHGTALADVLGRLKAAGLELVAEAPIDRLVEPTMAYRAAVLAGLPVARLTVDAVGDRLALLRRVERLMADVGAIGRFAPLARQWTASSPTTGFDDVKQVALARLLLPGIESIQVDWFRYGPKLAQVALTFGADDLDAVSAEEGAERGPRRTPLEEVRRNIRAASFTPVERNGRSEVITR